MPETTIVHISATPCLRVADWRMRAVAYMTDNNEAGL
ncbi:hypothetical protein AGR3A_Lc140061 [Agrobacterium tomkonis CFBP 6623]|uniref:Uncharacterized protein n=1 Tax=Agrobacterium tomkonis CFBP 6623 TaxID=1183432 RepID=A0A1S7RKZ0_9HYPH|nr:hypothetical protein AGR3A_Lc140061 [Agrobacterium tomkonis CFBP 6623]